MTTVQKVNLPDAIASDAAKSAVAKLGDAYREGRTNPLELGRRFLAAKRTYGLSNSHIRALSGIGLDALRHYISLVTYLDQSLQAKVKTGELSFKTARAIATVVNLSRQREIADALLSGEVQAKEIEKLVALVNSNTDAPIKVLCADITKMRGGQPQSAYRPVTFPGCCPRCKGQLVSRQEERSPAWYVSCIHCGFEVYPAAILRAMSQEVEVKGDSAAD